MTEFSADAVWGLSEKEFLSLLESRLFFPRTEKVRFYVPSFVYDRANPNRSTQAKFPTVSVTGRKCALGCKHCGGKVLNTMYPAETPERLFELAKKLKREGAVGCLMSGGCLPNGSVPLEQFTSVLRKMKQELGLTVIVHTGIVSSSTAKALKEAGVDAALIDVIGSDAILKKVCNLNVTVDYYEDSLRALHSAGLTFVPHIIVGLHDGTLDGELHALKIISKHEPSALVVIAFTPIRGTAMEHVKPPSPVAIGKVVAVARLMFSATPLALGCMRPKGKHRAESDILALKAGVDAIAFPSEDAVRYAEERGFEVAFSPYCCSQIYVDTNVRSVSK